MRQSSDRDWHHRVFCPCGWNDEHWAPTPTAFWYQDDICPKCATRGENFRVFVARWVSTAKLFQPRTWGKGYWEVQVGIGQTKRLTEIAYFAPPVGGSS